MAGERIEIQGLREFQANLRKIDKNAPKRLRLVQNEAANLIIVRTSPKIPARTGNARASLKARSSQRLTRIAVGGKKAPYYPWLDFGGTTGSSGAERSFFKEGRYLYPVFRASKPDVQKMLEKGIVAVAEESGMEVS